MKNYNRHLRAEEVDWKWTYDAKAKTHQLVLTHIATRRSVSGVVKEAGLPKFKVSDKKRELQESLRYQLEDLVFD